MQPHFFYIHTIILTISLNAEEAFFKRCCYMEATDFCNTPKWNNNLSQWKFVYKSWAVSHKFFFFVSDIDSFILSGFLVLDFMKLNVATTLNATKWGFTFWQCSYEALKDSKVNFCVNGLVIVTLSYTGVSFSLGIYALNMLASEINFSLGWFKVFLIGIHFTQDWTATTRHGVTRKRSPKRLKHTGNLFRKTYN